MNHIININYLHCRRHCSTTEVLPLLFLVKKYCWECCLFCFLCQKLLGLTWQPSPNHFQKVLGLDDRQIFPIFFFCLFRFLINWCYFFYTIQKLDDDKFFLFEGGLNFLIKTCLFFCFKNLLEKFEIFLLFSLLQINFFFYFCIVLMWWQTQGARPHKYQTNFFSFNFFPFKIFLIFFPLQFFSFFLLNFVFIL